MKFRRLMGGIIVALLAVTTVAAIGESEVSPASAADPGLFDPGYIVADHVFYDADSMSVAEIQSFLEARVPNCRATTGPACLRDYTMATTSRDAVAGRCEAYSGRASESAAQIIHRVGLACGISPKVLLVLLEKEQGLIGSTAPTAFKYRSATGFGCPDTAACDYKYYGFFNQLYSAAYQFKVYVANPNLWSYRAGQMNNVLYHPNAACGTKPVFIKNQATRALYIYTPYTPNAASMANFYGSGDSCSSYGNRNFWRIFSDWFGSPTGNGSPYGVVNNATSGIGQLKVDGWAADPDSSDPIPVHVYVDGVGAANVTADLELPALADRFGAGRTKRGYSVVLPNLSPGTHSVCVFGINVGSGANTLIGCREGTVLAGDPFGIVDQIAAYTGTLYARGWAIDPDVAGAAAVRLVVDGKVISEQAAALPKAGLENAFRGFGSDHGFVFTVTGVPSGNHRVCLQAVNQGAGTNTTLGCRDVNMMSGAPTFLVDEASSRAPGQITLRGWAIDPDVTDPVRVHIYVDGALSTKLTADVQKDSLASAYYGYGGNHAFSTTLTGLSSGNHQVCMVAIGVGVGGNSTHCYTVKPPTGSPWMHVDELRSSGLGTMTIRGWSIDPDVVAPVRVHVYVDGSVSGKVTADQPKASLGTAFPGYGDAHAFTANLSGIGPGDNSVCLYSVNVGGGANTSACYTASGQSGSPTLLLDEASAGQDSTILVRGWSIDPDTVEPTRIHLYVDGVLSTAITADMPKQSLAQAFPAFGSAHAFAITTAAVPRGVHQVCAFAINLGPGANSSTCRNVTVP